MANWWVNQGTKKGLADNKTVWALNTNIESADSAPNPYPNNDMWTKSGKKIIVDFTPFSKPLAKIKIPLEVRTSATGKEGPFNMNGDVQQGYFFPLSDDLAQTILNLK